jgi:phosphoribosylaminoimidazolecarboxamide formyltransferase/IMP cyclohydrolase
LDITSFSYVLLCIWWLLVTNSTVNLATAEAIQEIFFEVLIAPSFDEAALPVLTAKKNRILLQTLPNISFPSHQYRSLLNGKLTQSADTELILERS